MLKSNVNRNRKLNSVPYSVCYSKGPPSEDRSLKRKNEIKILIYEIGHRNIDIR